MRPNTVRERWRQDRPAIGSLLTLNSPLMAEVMGHVGFDWLGVDLQHSETSLANVQAMFQAVSSTAAMPLTRVAGNDSILFQRVLDLGAYGILVPMVETVDEAEAAASAVGRILAAARATGTIAGMQTYTPEQALLRAEQGFRLIGLASDVRFASAAARAALAATREGLQPELPEALPG